MFKGKAAVVTGGAMGIGAATVRRLIKEGASVVIADISAEAGTALAAELGQHAAFLGCDVRKEADLEAAIKLAEERFGPLYLMVNNAGIMGAMGYMDEMGLPEFEATLAVNLTSVFLGSKHAVRAMKASGTRGAIVNVTSAAGLRGGLGPAAYTTSKAGVIALTQQAACECAPAGIRVNSVAPAYVSTPMMGAFMAGDPAASVTEALEQGYAFKGHIPDADDVANAIVFLGSTQAAAVSGTNLLVDAATLTGVGGRPPEGALVRGVSMISELGKLGVNKDGGRFAGTASMPSPSQ